MSKKPYQPTSEDKKIYEGMSVVIATPCKDYEMSAAFSKDVVNMVAYSWMHGLKVYQMGITERMVIHWARNELAKKCRDHICEYTDEKFTHILWLDDDHVFNPDLLVWLARNSHLDVLSALYYGRVKHLPVVYVKDLSPGKYNHYPMISLPESICEVDAVGFGALLMRREILDTLKEPYFYFNEAGEDIYFCVHAKEQGVKIHLDGRYILGHIGDPKIVTKEVYEQYYKEHEADFGEKIKVGLGGKLHE